MVKVVIFDLYETLITSKEGPESKDEALSRILRKAGHGVYFQEIWSARQFVSFIDYPRGRANTPNEYYARVLEHLEIQPTRTLVENLTHKDEEMEETALYPDVAPCVRALKARGIKTSIVTTIASWRFEPVLERNDVKIDFVCTAREAKAVKPNPKSFTTVLDKFGVEPKEAIMVGDDIKTDIEPARMLGMKTVLLRRSQKIDCNIADHCVSSLAELPDLL